MCQLCKGRTKIVNGVGPKNAKIALVGEAPGAQEDAAGIPFVGRAGKFLDSILLKEGLGRESVFITNVVRCRPPDNRKPVDKEIECCLPYLVDELRKVKPKIVVAMGSVPIRALTGRTDKISDLLGKEIEICCNEVCFIVIPCYHPSAAMRNRKMKEEFEKIIASAVKSIESS